MASINKNKILFSNYKQTYRMPVLVFQRRNGIVSPVLSILRFHSARLWLSLPKTCHAFLQSFEFSSCSDFSNSKWPPYHLLLLQFRQLLVFFIERFLNNESLVHKQVQHCSLWSAGISNCKTRTSKLVGLTRIGKNYSILKYQY